MNISITVTQRQLSELLLNIAVARPVFIWGPPGIDILEKSEDFPNNGPLLIITDGYCEPLKIHREHAFLIPKGSNLPFIPKGKVFRFS
ncbi:MAG: hypothetical protein Q8942_16455 [Bacillota bacterium]|nr:hypothetical protein [Bacillota bacterium]